MLANPFSRRISVALDHIREPFNKGLRIADLFKLKHEAFEIVVIMFMVIVMIVMIMVVVMYLVTGVQIVFSPNAPLNKITNSTDFEPSTLVPVPP